MYCQCLCALLNVTVLSVAAVAAAAVAAIIIIITTKDCKVEVAFWAVVSNKPMVSVDVKQHSATTIHVSLNHGGYIRSNTYIHTPLNNAGYISLNI